MLSEKEILSLLPYSEPFLFVDQLIWVNDEGAEGRYCFRRDEYFYRGHFKNRPVTPGVILTECMAQIGLVALGIYLVGENIPNGAVELAFTSAEVDFLQPVLPGEEVRVEAQKKRWRLGKLTVDTVMYNQEGKLVCKGTLSGMIKARKNEQ